MIIGIDLGTSTTEAAVYRNGTVEMIPNHEGKIVTPSVIGIDDEGELIIGEKAYGQYCIYPERTAIEVKRKLGSDEKIKLGDRSYTPIELSAMLLTYVRECASKHLGEDIKRAVISVPAYFDDIQRQAVIKAGESAGFTVERLINEPTAAALSYGINNMEEESHILVYDLGGGTFDVTLLEMFGGVLEVKASSGDNQLGGKDFDECLIEYMKERFKDATGVTLKKDPYALARLKDEAEKCKKALSSEDEYTVRLPMLAEKKHMPVGLEERIMKAQFEELVKGLVERTHTPIITALGDGDVKEEELDRILLVGGSTRMPIVQEDIANLLGQPPASAIHPDYSVAEGAAIQAAIIDGVLEEGNRLVVTDVNPFTLGVRSATHYSLDNMSVIIPRNTTIPVTRKQIYYTFVDMQEEATIEVYQGEYRIATKNHFLGRFILSGIPPAKAGKEAIEISFSYDLNGMLKIEAKVLSTGMTGNIVVNMLEGGKEETIDVKKWRQSPSAGMFRASVRRGEKKLKNLEPDDPLYDELDDLLYELKKAVIQDNIEKAEELEEELLYLI